MSDKDLQIESAVTESVEDVGNEVTEIENEDDQNGDEAPKSVNDKKLSRRDLEDFARNMKQQHDYLIKMKRVRSEYENAVELGKLERVQTDTLDHFLDVQTQALVDSIALGKELEKLLPKEEKKVAIPPATAKEKTDKKTKNTPKTSKKPLPEPVKAPEKKLTKREEEKLKKDEVFISIFDFYGVEV